MPADPNQPDDIDALTDAGAVIDRFGGIRPMAAKMRVPVTTVQGWKKRNVIPGNRRADVLLAAQAHHIDLSDIVANQNNFSAALKTEAAAQAQNPDSLRPHEQAIAAARATEAQEAREKAVAGVTHEVMMKEINKAQTRAIRRSMVASLALLAVFAVIYGMLLAINKQQVAQQTKRIATIESRVETIGQGAPASSGKTIPPGVVESMMQDMNQKFYDLRNKTESLQVSVKDLKAQAESFMSLENSSLVDRVMELESKLGGLSGGNTDLSALLGRIGEMQKSLEGQQQLEATVAQLQAMMAGMQAQQGEAVDNALAAEQQSGDSELAQTLEGVSPEQLKAAALLIGLSQFRDSMNRSGPFSEDLALLQTMLGDKDPQLNEAIAQLAPYAEKGVLSPKGLSEELKSLTGEIVVASIAGKDVSVQEKAMARFQEVLKIQKDGKPVMGSDAQAKVARAQALLDSGDVDGAIAELESIEGPARTTVQPVLDQAEITRMAHQVQGMLTNNVMGQIKTGLTAKRVPYTAAPRMNIPGVPPGAMGPFAPHVYIPPKAGE
ncbi:MAG: uroporphyrinogen III synthase HEM4 [Micavibrio aeruginosavorus]|nr:uroporphyrinogen III synthase HEM4 [Micavibrio aeruginosavorus]